jgi:hypothetical protein
MTGQALAPQAVPGTAGGTHASDEPLRALVRHVEAGLELKNLRIRSQTELDAARKQKLAWVTQANDLLLAAFGSQEIVDSCNDWVGKVYPEYVDFENFVAQFHAEMDHRVRRLYAVLRRREPAPKPAVAPATAIASSQPLNPRPAQPQHERPPVMNPVLLLASADHASTRQTVAGFLKQVQVAHQAPEVAEPAQLLETIERCESGGFALLVGASIPTEWLFAVGVCVGRLGSKRVAILNPEPGAQLREVHGLLQLPLDLAGGWQLQLARQLKHAGVTLDLNRLLDAPLRDAA